MKQNKISGKEIAREIGKDVVRKTSERIEKSLEYLKVGEEGKAIRKKGEVIRNKYFDLMEEYYAIRYKLEDEYSNEKKYFCSMSTPTKRMILEEIDGELLSLRENGEEQDEGVKIDELGELERKLDTIELPISYSFPRECLGSYIGAVPSAIEISEHKNGYGIKINYVSGSFFGKHEPYRDQDSFELFTKTLLGRNILFARFNSPVGKSLTHYGGTWALGMSSTTYESDRYGGLIAIQELNEKDNLKEIAKSKIDKIVQRVKNYSIIERERTIRKLQGLEKLYEAKHLVGKDEDVKDIIHVKNMLKELGGTK